MTVEPASAHLVVEQLAKAGVISVSDLITRLGGSVRDVHDALGALRRMKQRGEVETSDDRAFDALISQIEPLNAEAVTLEEEQITSTEREQRHQTLKRSMYGILNSSEDFDRVKLYLSRSGFKQTV